jgi:hypothetical protein
LDRERVRGIVINVHGLGAAVRLEDGRLAAAPIGDVVAHRAAYERACRQRAMLTFDASGDPRRPHLLLARPDADETVRPTAEPIALTNDAFEERMAAYLKSTEAWAPPDAIQPFERHLIRKARVRAYRGEA